MSKYALLVGINKYKEPGNDLAGCINDIKDMDGYLSAHGFPPENIHTLKDDEGRKSWMIDELNWLMEVGKDDSGPELLYHYSGHGSQVRAKPADGEPDGLTEILCPWDCDLWWDKPLSDDVLRDIFKAKPKTANLTVILDCCHSGHGTRHNDPNIRPRYRQGPESITESPTELAVPTNRIAVKQTGRRGGPVAEDMNHLLFAACKDNQTAADAVIGGRPNGAWTWGLMQILKGIVEPVARDVFFQAGLLIRGQYEQRPVIEGKRSLQYRPFLGGHKG